MNGPGGGTSAPSGGLNTVDVIIPTYRPGSVLEELLRRLSRQSVQLREIHVINTVPEGEENSPEQEAIRSLPERWERLRLTEIAKSAFDHGGTRRMGAEQSRADVMVFMTQDALPADEKLLEKLIQGLSQGPKVGAAYARQLPNPECREIERYTRSFNYPSIPALRSQEDTEHLGIRTYFCSNVCAAYRREAYVAVGGFPERTIFNEDMICCGRMLQQGWQVAYVPEARVIHSHNYRCSQQFHRNFDLGVSQADFPEIFSGFTAEGEGFSLVTRCAGHLMAVGKPWLVPYLGVQTVCKYAGYRLGKAYRRLPRRLVLRCTDNRTFWGAG